jgi:hypothetical protein
MDFCQMPEAWQKSGISAGGGNSDFLPQVEIKKISAGKTDVYLNLDRRENARFPPLVFSDTPRRKFFSKLFRWA